MAVKLSPVKDCARICSVHLLNVLEKGVSSEVAEIGDCTKLLLVEE